MIIERTIRKRTVSPARRIVDVVGLALMGVAAWFMWPSFLGGSSQVILVHGHSMEPTYMTGDLVVIDTSAMPQIGDIIVFQIPKDEPGGGQHVVHRLIGRRDDGTYITQGDNAPNPDAFLTERSDILGSPRFSIPHGGRAIGMLGSPIGLGGVAGVLCSLLLWPRKRVDDVDNADDATDKLEAPEVEPIAVADEAIAERVIAADVATEAEAWLRDQLELLASASG